MKGVNLNLSTIHIASLLSADLRNVRVIEIVRGANKNENKRAKFCDKAIIDFIIRLATIKRAN